MEIEFSKDGTPLLFASDRMFGVTKEDKSTNTSRSVETFHVGEREFVAWGPDNRYPDNAIETIGSTGVLSTGIGFRARTCFGQGVVPMEIRGFDDKGEPVLRHTQNVELLRYFQGFQFRKYATQGFRDLVKVGNLFPVFYFNERGDKIVNVVAMNARHCRLSRDKRKLLVFTDFWCGSSPTPETCVIIDMLDENDPFQDLENRRLLGKLKAGKPLAFPRVANYYSNTDYYGVPDWDTAWKAGWVDIAHRIPKFLQYAYSNAMSMMWHIQVPRSYWEKNFPLEKFDGNVQRREEAVSEHMHKLDERMRGEENASKTLITDFEIGLNGKAEEKWTIERLNNEIDAKERLSTSAAANSEILFSLMVNPAVMGAGMPGGSYAGNAGSGSDIREAFMVSAVLTYIEKQQCLDPIYLMLKYNGHEDIVLKYKDTILTTLNTGQAQKQITT